MEMDEMELERYINGMLDTEQRNLRKNVSADKHKHKCKKDGDEQNETGQRVVETNR